MRTQIALCIIGFIFVPHVIAADTWVGEKVMQKKPKVKFGDWIGGKQVYFD